jgi:ABC-type multidrug transport system fused ATPase/permease subunit
MTAVRRDGFWRSLRRLYSLLQPGRRREVWVIAFLTLTSAVTEIATIGAVVPFLALLASGSGSSRIAWIEPAFGAIGATSRGEQLVAASLFLAIAAIGAAVVRIVLLRFSQDFIFAFGHQLAVEIQRRTLLQAFAWHSTHNSSEQLATIARVELVTASVLLPLVQALAATFLVISVAAVLVQFAPLTTLAAGAALGTSYWLIALVVRKRLELNSRRLDSALERRIRVLQEGLGGIRDVILDGSQAHVLDAFRQADLQVARAQASTSVVARMPRFLIESGGIIVIAGVTLVLAGREGGLVAALPVLGALALGAQRLLPLIQQLFDGWSNVAANKSLLDDIVRRLELPVPEFTESAPRLAFKRSIEFRDVSFSYADRLHPAVENLSFTIGRGSRIALTGPTGSGKSTTADLLMGLLEPSDGLILVDGVALTDENRQRWRANVAHVPQSPFVSDASFARNIAVSADIDMDRVRKAAALAQLDTFIESLPQGYETQVGERGARMSGGQLQRLAIARAIYKDTPLLVLDEATSGLDTATEAAILSALDRLQERGRTIVIISHRATTTARCNRALRLKAGRLTELVQSA